ncbi:MAG: hypothetical protein U1E55_03080 [Paracoccus sp. (in: a-proteobacteria)]
MLRRIARDSGTRIVMGAGYYLGTSLPGYFHDLSVKDIADQIVDEDPEWHRRHRCADRADQ